MILDIHSHRPAPYPLGIVNCSALLPFSPVEGQNYSVGIHPWDVSPIISEREYAALEEAALRPEVVAIGECGLDLLRGGPLYKQILIFKRHIDLSESIGKPLILHCVRAHDHILSLRREFKPLQPWIIHGFRQRPSIADNFIKAGCFLSFGERYNPQSLISCPPEKILAETDDSDADISSIISSLAESISIAPEDLAELIADNSQALFSPI